jgi:hypothetical protein
MRARSERGARVYDCPRLGRPVVVSYLQRECASGRVVPAGVHCAGARECGVEQVDQEGRGRFTWDLCPLWPEFVRDGYLPP